MNNQQGSDFFSRLLNETYKEHSKLTLEREHEKSEILEFLDFNFVDFAPVENFSTFTRLNLLTFSFDFPRGLDLKEEISDLLPVLNSEFNKDYNDFLFIELESQEFVVFMGKNQHFIRELLAPKQKTLAHTRVYNESPKKAA